MTDQSDYEQAWAARVLRSDVVADGHKLLTLGAHTGHVWKVIAYCETAALASEMAKVLARGSSRSAVSDGVNPERQS